MSDFVTSDPGILVRAAIYVVSDLVPALVVLLLLGVAMRVLGPRITRPATRLRRPLLMAKWLARAASIGCGLAAAWWYSQADRQAVMARAGQAGRESDPIGLLSSAITAFVYCLLFLGLSAVFGWLEARAGPGAGTTGPHGPAVDMPDTGAGLGYMRQAPVRILTLTGAAITSALVWRAEIGWHGWAGLEWVGYFHWAIPFGWLLFLAWVGHYCGIQPRWKRLLFLLSACAYAFVAYTAVYVAACLAFGGPSAMFLFSGPLWFLLLPLCGMPVLYPLIPFLFCALARAFGARIPATRTLLSIIVFLSAYPLALLILSVTGYPYVDAAQTIKTGTVIPFLVIGMGVPFLWSDRRDDAREPTAHRTLP